MARKYKEYVESFKSPIYEELIKVVFTNSIPDALFKHYEIVPEEDGSGDGYFIDDTENGELHDYIDFPITTSITTKISYGYSEIPLITTPNTDYLISEIKNYITNLNCINC